MIRISLKPSVLYSHLSTVFFNGFLTLTTGVFLNDYLLRIGFKEYDMGILYSLYYLTGFIAFPVSFWANSVRRKKTFYLVSHALSLVFFLVFISAPYIPNIGSRGVVWVSIVSIGMFYVFTGAGRLVLIPWMYQEVGSDNWLRFFQFRLILAYAVPIVVLVGFGSLLKIDGIHTLSVLFVLALVLGALGTLCMGLFPESNSDYKAETNSEKLGTLFGQMVKHPGFLTILVYCCLLSFGVGLFTPIVYPYLITEAGIESSKLSYFQVIMTLTSIGSTYWISRICNRHGTMTALVWISSVLWTVPIILMCIPYSVDFFTGMLFAMGFVDGYGIIFTGTFIALMNLSLQHTPQKNQTVYLAFIEFVKALFLSTGSYLGGWIAQYAGEIFADSRFAHGYRLVFLLSMTIMAAAFLVALRLNNASQKSTSRSPDQTIQRQML